MTANIFRIARFVFGVFAILASLQPSAVCAAEPAGLLESKAYLADDIDGLYRHYLQTATAADPASVDGRMTARTAMLLASRIAPAVLADHPAAIAACEAYLALPPAKQDPLAHDMAAAQLAGLRYAAGDFAAGAKLLAGRAAVPQWLVSGPFGRYDRASFYEQLPPERASELDKKMPAVGREAEWRMLPAGSALLRFDPWDWVSPRRGIAYVLTAFRLPQDGPVVLDIQTQCTYQLWLDGRPAGTADRFDQEIPERQLVQEEKNAPLKAGWHLLLIKLYGSSENRDLTCRLLDATLQPQKGIEFAATREAVQTAIDEITNTAPRSAGATQSYIYQFQPVTSTKWTFSRPSDYHRVGLPVIAAGLQANGGYDAALTRWQMLTANGSDVPAFWAQRGDCERQCAFLPEPRRESLARQSHLQAVKLDPACVPSLLALADHERRNRRFAAAADYYEKALKANPASLRALASRAEMALQNGWTAEGERWLQELQKRYPQAQATLLLQAERKDEAGGLPRTAALLEKALQNDRLNLRLALDAARYYASAGDLARAQATLALLPPALAALPQVQQAHGQLLLHSGQAAAAADLFQKASDAQGGDAACLRSVGEARMQAGDEAAALAAFETSLALASEQHELRRLVSELKKTNYAFWKDYVRDPVAAMRKFSKENKEMAGKNARLIDQTILTLYPDGSYTNYTHELQRVLTPAGVREAAEFRVFGELLSARTLLPERDLVLEPVILPGQDNITMPAVAPGAGVDYSYLQSQESPGDLNLNFPKWYFRSPDSEETFVFSQYIVRVTPGTPFAFAARNMNRKMKFEKKAEDDGTQVYIWTGQDMPLAVHEEGSPGIDETLPFVAIASDRSWDGVNRLFLNYCTGRLFVSSAMHDEIRRLTTPAAGAAATTAATAEAVAAAKGGSSKDAKSMPEREIVSALFDFVCRNIERTPAFSPASFIYDQRSGDRVLLLLALLRGAGIEADFAAARPSEAILTQPVWDLPASGAFTTFLVQARLKDGSVLWLDPSGRFNRAGSLNEEIAGGSAFVTGRDSGSFRVLPPAQPADYTVRDERAYTLRGRDLAIDGTCTIPGLRGGLMKEKLEGASASEQQNMAEELLAGGLPGLELEQSSFPGADRNDQPLQVKFRAVVPAALRGREDGMQGLPAGLPSLPLLPSEDNVQRKTPYHLDRYVAQECVYTLSLPAGAQQTELPPPLISRTEFGFYQLSFERAGDTVVVRRSCHFPPQRIALERWSAYYALTRQIAEAEAARIWWK